MLYGESAGKAEKLNALFRNRQFNLLELILRLFEPYFTTNENINQFGGPLLEFLTSISDTPLFKSVMNNSYQNCMSLLQEFSAMARNHFSVIHRNLQIIINSNLRKEGDRQPTKQSGQDDSSVRQSLDQNTRVRNGVINRALNDRSMDRLNSSRTNLLPADNQADVDKAWNASKAAKFRDDVRNRMHDGKETKLTDAQNRKLNEQAKVRQEKIEKDRQVKDEMVEIG